LGDRFCPLDAGDEDWISAAVPAISGRPGRIAGDLLASHFAFFPQENRLLQLGLLDRYYALAGLTRTAPLPLRSAIWRTRLRERWRRPRPIPIAWRATPLARLP
jgi:hypothetical protein